MASVSGQTADVRRIQRWVDEFAPTFACWDLVSLLHESGQGEYEAEGLKQALNLDDLSLRRAVEHLEARRVVVRGEFGSVAYRPDEATEARVDAFLAALDSHSGRLVAVSRVLERAMGVPGTG